MYFLGILGVIVVIVLANVIVALTLCKSMAITDDLHGTRE